jgi:hypothetical protein
MKKFLVIPLLLALVISLSACREMEKLKESLVYLEPFDVHAVGNYEGNQLILFIVDADKDYFLKGYNLEELQVFQLDSIGENYGYGEGPFMPVGYDAETSAIYGQEYIYTENISIIEFKQKAKPLIQFILKNPQDPREIMKQAAIDLGFIEQIKGTSI